MNGTPGLVVAVYGLINAGKSSLINALETSAGRETSPVGGTTGTVQVVRWKEGPNGLGPLAVSFVDTPGLEEVGDQKRSRMATDAAWVADLVLFVVAEDLTDRAFEALSALHRVGKPMVVAFNKVDLLSADERSTILTSIQERLAGMIDADDVIPVAAAPIVRERVIDAEGRSRVETTRGEPEIAGLRARLVEAIVESEADLRDLNAARLEVETHRVAKLDDQAVRRARAIRVADETSLGVALALAVNPIPLADFLTGPTGLAILVTRVAHVYGETPSPSSVRATAGELLRGGRIALWGSIATVVVGGFLKVVPGLGHVAGGMAQGTAAGYLAHLMGRALVDYHERGHDWGEGGLVARLEEIAARTDRKALTRGLVAQLKERLGSKPSRSSDLP